MFENNFYTFEELKNFTNNFTNLTITNITKFIEIKTSKEYVIVKKQLFDNTIVVFEIQKLLNDIWFKVTEKNNTITNKWKEQLKDF